MNKRLLSITCMALTLCMFSTPSSANDVKLFGISAEAWMTMGAGTLTIKHAPTDIFVLDISDNGLTQEEAAFKDESDSRSLILNLFSEQKPKIVSERILTIEAKETKISGSIAGKQEISISSERFDLSIGTILGTNGTITLNFTDPKSLIKSITLEPSAIVATNNGQELHIGSIWGTGTGIPSSKTQKFHFSGYTSLDVRVNTDAIAALLSKK